MAKSTCPNINDREYKALAAQVGTAKAHTIYDINNGHPVSLNADGSPSSIYEDVKTMYGESKAIEVRTKMFSENFTEMAEGFAHEKLSINKAGAIVLPDGTTINMLSKGYKSDNVSQHMRRLDVIEAGQRMNDLFEVLETALPGLTIHRETQQSLANTKHAGQRAYIDNTGLHFNIHAVSYDTPIHEITHPWLYALEMQDNVKYNYLMNQVKNTIPENQDIYNLIKRKYPNLNEQQLLREYAATIAGFIGAKEVRKFMYRNSKYITESKSVETKSKFTQLVSDIWKAIKQMFGSTIVRKGTSALAKLDFMNSSLDNIFEALAEDVLMGKGVIGLNYNQMEALVTKYYTDDYHDASAILFENMNPISKLSDVVPYLMHRPDAATSVDEEQKQKDVEKVMSNGLRKNQMGMYERWEYGKKIVFPADITKEELEKRVREEIVDKRYELMNSFNDKMISIVSTFQKYNGSKSVEEIIEQTFDLKLSPTQIKSIADTLRLIGINQPISNIYHYSDLKNIPELSHLYHPALESYNYVVFIHGQSESEIDMSIIDFANGKLGWQDNILPDNMFYLGSTFGYDGSTFTMSNRIADIRKILVATTLAGMNKKAMEKGQRIRLRKAGVVGNENMNVSTHMISNINEVFKNARTLFGLSEVQSYYDPNSTNMKFINELIADDSAFSGTTIMQSWKNILESYYLENKVKLGLSDEYTNNLLYDTKLLRERRLEIMKKYGYENNEEFKILSMLLLYMEHHIDVNSSQMKDISSKFKNITNPHNVKHDAVQMFSVEAERVKSYIINQLNDFKDEFQKLTEASMKSHGRSLLSNKPEDIFGHLFKKANIVLKNDSKYGKTGQTIQLTMFNQIYGSYDINEARKAGLTDADIALCDYIIENTVKRYVANIKHNLRNSTGMKKTDKEIEDEVRDKLQNGRIPIIPMTRSEMLRRGRVLSAAKKNFDKKAKGELMAGEESSYNEVHFAYNSQLNEADQLLQMGLEPITGTNAYKEIDITRYDQQTQNLEYMMNMFMHDGLRKVEIDTQLIPAYKSIKQWLRTIKEDFYNNDNSQKVVEEYLDDYYNRIVLRRNKDEGDKIDSWLRNGLNMFSFVALGYRPTVWMRSAYYNMQAVALESITKSVVTSISKDEAMTLNIPGVDDMAKANAVLLKDFSKIMKLGKKFSIINSSEIDAIESIFTTMADKHAFRTQIAQLGNYYSDMIARLVTMTAYMMHDGSYEAHSFNKETNQLSYDVTKDKRFYKDGKWINENAKIIYNDLELSLERDGLKGMVGYDFRDANTRFKWYADKFIIGSMDEYQKALLGQTALGAMAMQFRNYLPDRLFNLLGSNRLTSYGAVREVRMNADNEVEVIRKQIEMEGSFASLWYYLKDVVKVVKTKDMTLSELNESLSPIRRHNLAKEVSRAILLTGIVLALYMMCKAGLSDRDRKKLEFLWSELAAWRPVTDMTQNLLPISSSISDIWSIITGQGGWNKLMRYTGPVYDTMWYLELLTDYDNILLTGKQERKINAMNEKELQEYRTRMKQVKERRELVEDVYKDLGLAD